MTKLPKDKQMAFDSVLQGHNVFVTGVAGTGKSYWLNYLNKNSGLNLKITATTGIAAVNVKGQTIHSFAGVGLAKGSKDDVLKSIKKAGSKRIKKCRVLVIEEISMMSDDLFVKLDYCFRGIRKSDKPFGGVQLVVLGDFLQLPPIKRGNNHRKFNATNYSNLFCFETQLWRDCNFVAVELTKVYRQSEQDFVDLLNNVRTGTCTELNLKTLEACIYDAKKVPSDIKPVVLTSKNARCDKINGDELDKIDKEIKSYHVRATGTDWKIKSLIKDSKIVEHLELKVGAQVMLTVNLDQPRGLVNGSTGVVTKFKNGNPVVKFTNGRHEEIDFYTWESLEYNPDTNVQEPSAIISQMPLRLAWAITIHKSQGMTIPYIYAELQDVFTDAQVYVALSRAQNLKGLFISGFDRRKIMVNPVAKKFYENIEDYCQLPNKKLF